MTESELLHSDALALRALFSDESKWTKGAFHRDASGNEAARDAAVCWDLQGGINKVAYRNPYKLTLALSRAIGNRAIADFNDDPTITFADIIRVLDRLVDQTRP